MPSFLVLGLNRTVLSVFGVAAMICACGGSDDDASGGVKGGSGTTGVGGTIGTGTGGTNMIPVGGVSGTGGSGTGSGGSAGSSGTGCGSNLTGRIRDFAVSHPDFEYELGDDRGIVTDMLGADGKPVYANGNGGTATTTNAESFNQWFNDVAGINEAEPLLLMFTQGAGGVYTYEDSSFFPIDGRMLGNEGNSHNYHFTFELHTTFVYNGGETFRFRGDDDVFAYINGRLVIDLGGVHTVQEDSVDLDAQAGELGLTVGSEYKLDFFFAERHTSESNFRIDTSIVFKDCGSGGEPT
ncbi:MAG TPA: fibro-slime domain-containing protein [Polyangiaceae bacterium]|nr:fibro-slime domain-containing protein [Polyangiaceae bacterium]